MGLQRVLELEEGLCCSQLLLSALAHRHKQILPVANNIAQMMGACQISYLRAKQNIFFFSLFT